MKLSNIKEIKTTVLGALFIALAFYLLIMAVTFDYIIIGGLISIGVLLFFTGDKFINQVEQYVWKFIAKKMDDAQK